MSTTVSIDNTNQTPAGQRTVLVHKADAEGALIINALSGQIEQDPMERPEWAEGLACGLTGERHKFYTDRLGPYYTDEQKLTDTLAFEDLGWLAVDPEGNPVELEADAEHRMSVVAEVLGMNRPDDLWEPTQITRGRILAEVEIGMDRERTEGEVAALERAQEQGFGTGQQRANG